MGMLPASGWLHLRQLIVEGAEIPELLLPMHRVAGVARRAGRRGCRAKYDSSHVSHVRREVRQRGRWRDRGTKTGKTGVSCLPGARGWSTRRGRPTPSLVGPQATWGAPVW
jgi:hypothetical protein